MAYIDWKDLLDATNKGLEIIAMYYPEAPHALQTANKKFRVDESDKTPSSSIRLKDGYYHVTHFNADQKERNAIGICMYETGKSFKEAIQYLASHFGLEGSSTKWLEIRPEWNTRPLKEDEEPNTYEVKFKDFTDEELAELGPCVTEKHCQDYNLHSVEHYTYFKANEASTIGSNDKYPIFSFHHETWSKVYQPLSYKKEFRFSFLGKKPKRFVYGMDLLRKEYKANKKRIDDAYDADEKNFDTDPRVDHVFIVSGGSDGLNLRSFGYIALWYNSESEQLNFDEYRELQTLAKEIIYVPDLDSTGIKQAVKLGLKYLDIKIMMLPGYLKLKTDRRGKPCKDFKDFVINFFNPKEAKSFNSKLKKLIETALPTQFWTETYTKNAKKYTFRQTQFYNFLKMNGFGRIKDEHTKDGYHFVYNDGNVFKRVLPVEIEAFVHQYLKRKQMPTELRDLVYSKQLSNNALNKLDVFDVDFTTSGAESQYMFFENKIVHIDPKGVSLLKRGDIESFIWEKKLIKHNIRVNKEEPFKISNDKHGNKDIVINETDNWFFNYLINASRIYWRKDLEEGLKKLSKKDQIAYKEKHKFDIAAPNLDDNEVLEQKLHLINKIYALGYMLHTYKSPHRPWAVYAMDNKIADVSESHGGSGKSVFQKAIQTILKQNHYIPGRDPRKTSDDFIYHGVTQDTDYVLVDDCHKNLDYGFFFPAITGDLEVNNKNGLRFVIPFDDVPKICFSSNYPPNNLDPSLSRRLLYIVYSDYYHYNQEDEYNESRSVSDDFEGKNLFKDFDDAQWNKFYNFCIYAIKFYLSQKEKIEPPMANVVMRNLLSEMGQVFKEWADVFFLKMEKDNSTPKYLNRYVVKEEAYEDYCKGNKYTKTPNAFKKALKAYCKFNEWEFNPPSSGVKNGRIMQKHEGETKEMFFIDTTGGKMQDVINTSTEDKRETTTAEINNQENDDLPWD